jgi:hypothetical protein
MPLLQICVAVQQANAYGAPGLEGQGIFPIFWQLHGPDRCAIQSE